MPFTLEGERLVLGAQNLLVGATSIYVQKAGVGDPRPTPHALANDG